VVLKNASLSVTVDDTAHAVVAMSRLAEESGGFVVQSTVSQQTKDGTTLIYGSVTLRVPAEKLNDVLDKIKALSISTTSEEITGEDVTQKYVDLSTKLNSLKVAETQLQKIMDSAQKTEDVLNVYSRLSDIEQQMDLIKGQIKYYDQASALSLVSISIAPKAANLMGPILQWQPANTVSIAVNLLGVLIRGIVDLAIYLIIVGVPIGLLFLVGFAIYQRIRRLRKPPSVDTDASSPT
jgi:hypothetical protein